MRNNPTISAAEIAKLVGLSIEIRNKTIQKGTMGEAMGENAGKP